MGVSYDDNYLKYSLNGKAFSLNIHNIILDVPTIVETLLKKATKNTFKHKKNYVDLLLNYLMKITYSILSESNNSLI